LFGSVRLRRRAQPDRREQRSLATPALYERSVDLPRPRQPRGRFNAEPAAESRRPYLGARRNLLLSTHLCARRRCLHARHANARVHGLSHAMSLPRRPKAVVFDLDGTLIDSEALVREAYRITSAAFNVGLTDAQFLALVGLNRDDNDKTLLSYWGADFPL